MKKYLLSLLAVTAVTAFAQEKVMRIHYANGTSETKKVSDVVKLTFEDEGESPIDPQGPQMVDMGLSVKWATYNIGATAPEEYGNFYAYGETEPKSEYTLENYKWYYPDYNDWDCDEWEKYFKLGATITGTNYDVAHVKWGEEWRIPTQEEWEELFNKCEWQWTAVNGVTGAKAISKVNGNSIFFPAAGNMVDAEHTHDQIGCFYWTSTEYNESNDITAECRNYRANFDATNRSAKGYDYPEVGFSIRAVYGPAPIDEPDEVVVPDASEAVDLGLSVKWAPFNVGAASSSADGNWYCWGEISEKLYAHIYNYKYYDPLTDSYANIGEDISDTDYDVVKESWGQGWRMPTYEEMKELLEKCEWTASYTGYTVTGPNGNSIFLKASGQMTYKGYPTGYLSGYYMTSTLSPTSKDHGSIYGLLFSRGSGNNLSAPSIKDWLSRAGGLQVRPVHD